jgi:hypothetical protein
MKKEIFEKFSEGVRCILLLERRKDSGTGKSSNCFDRKITTNKQEFFETIDKFEDIKNSYKGNLRIYSSVNSRDISKAIREFKHEQLEADYYDKESKNGFYLDLKNRFIHCLMKPRCKAESNFLFDFDGCCDRSFSQICKEIEKHTEIISYYKTKNGYHVITKPFNHTKIGNDERFKGVINTDGLLLISY